MAKARSGAAVRSKIQMVIFGEPFTGKSTLASQLAYMHNPDGSPFKILYLDPESGSIDDYIETMEANGVKGENLYIVYTQSLSEVRQYIQMAKNGEDFPSLDDDGNIIYDDSCNPVPVLDADGKPFRADAIVVDGATILNLTTKQGLIEFSKKRAAVRADDSKLIGDKRIVKVEGAGLEFKDYNTINFKGQDLILDLNACGLHYIVTAREVDEKKTIEIRDSNGNIEAKSIATGKKIPEGFKEMDYNCKTCIRMYRGPDNYEIVHAKIIKDRSGVHTAGEDIEDPSLLDYQAVIDRTAKFKDVVIKNSLKDAIKAEEQIYTKENCTSTGESSAPAGSAAASNEKPSAASVRNHINEKIRSISDPKKKNAIKTKISSAGLPTSFSTITDVDVLQKVASIIDAEVA